MHNGQKHETTFIRVRKGAYHGSVDDGDADVFSVCLCSTFREASKVDEGEMSVVLMHKATKHETAFMRAGKGGRRIWQHQRTCDLVVSQCCQNEASAYLLLFFLPSSLSCIAPSRCPLSPVPPFLCLGDGKRRGEREGRERKNGRGEKAGGRPVRGRPWRDGEAVLQTPPYLSVANARNGANISLSLSSSPFSPSSPSSSPTTITPWALPDILLLPSLLPPLPPPPLPLLLHTPPVISLSIP